MRYQLIFFLLTLPFTSSILLIVTSYFISAVIPERAKMFYESQWFIAFDGFMILSLNSAHN